MKGRSCEMILQQNCTLFSDCAFRLGDITINCGNLLMNEATECSPNCSESLKSIETFAIGKELINCKCETSKCLALRGRFERCWNGTAPQQAARPCSKRKNKRRCHRRRQKKDKRNNPRNHQIAKKSCSKLHEKCISKPRCKKRFDKYFADCHHLFEGYNCTSTCIKATKKYFEFKINKKYTVGQRMRRCECDGTLEKAITCHTERQHREKLCPDL